MALPGETIGLGASPYCPDCKKKSFFEICHSNAGYYIGTQCCCGPYTRESRDYYRTQEGAQKALDEDTWIPRT